MSFTQFIEILKARWILVVAVLAVTVLGVVGVSLLWVKQYTAVSTVIIDSRGPDPINGMVMNNMLMPGYIATQIDVVTSERVTRKVIKTLKLDQSPELRQQWQDDANGQGSFEAWLSELLQKSLTVSPSRESSVINISYSAVDPRFAAALANTFMQAYIDTTLELRVEPARQFSTLFEGQSKLARDRLEAAQAKLSDYQKAKGLIATDERLDIESVRLSELSSQLVALQAVASESGSRRAQASANMAEVLNNPVVSGLTADVSRLQARMKETQAKFGSAHPQVLELQANISELQAKRDAEIGRVTSSVSINDRINRSREAQVRVSLDEQRQKVLRLKEQRDEAAVLLRDVEDAQRNYDALRARFAQTSLESQNNQTNVSVLKYAEPPYEHSTPKLLLNTAIAVFLGAIIGLGAAIVTELLRRRIRTEDDFVHDMGVPLLGIMPVAASVKGGGMQTVKVSPRLARRSLPELSAPLGQTR
ncbi:MAG: chain length determinant protein EpsF [Rubrivivax sp.]|nr:MAG: chain length determinant protein EpsF [Rubrivivax sp.]